MHARNFEKPVHWHRKYRSTRKRQLCRGDKGRRGWYGKRSLEEEKKERKKRKKREKEKRKSQRADRWPAGTKLKGYDATGWAGTTVRGKKGAGMRIGIEGTPVVLAKVIFRLDGLVYFAILWGKISLSCLRRRPLSLSSWLRDHYFGTWLPWTFIRQTFAVVSHPATFLLFSPFFFFFFLFYFQTTRIHYYADVVTSWRIHRASPFLALPTFVCLVLVAWYVDVLEQTGDCVWINTLLAERK